MKTGTIALIIAMEDGKKQLVESISDDHEVMLLEDAYKNGDEDPLEIVYKFREKITQEDEEFGDYVEELLSQPFLRKDIRDHGLEWFRSKLRIEEYRRNETEATAVISEYAYKMYCEDLNKTDFILCGPSAKVRICVFDVSQKKEETPLSDAA